MAGNVFVDVHLQVPSYLSVSEGHFIGEKARHELLLQIDDVTDVTVHIDPEDDHLYPSCVHLPDRATLLPKLVVAWEGLIEEAHIERSTLHYYQNKIYIELQLPVSKFDTEEKAGTLLEKLHAALDSSFDVASVKLFFTTE
jgi:hypothetical protein